MRADDARESMNILVTFDEGYIAPFKVLARSVAANSPEYRANFILVHSSVSDACLDGLRAYCDGLGAEFAAIAIDEGMFGDAPVTQRYPLAVYYRLLAPHILPPSVDRVIYLDCDILVINSLAPLWEMDLCGMAFAAASRSGEVSVADLWNQMRLGTECAYFNTGVLVMDVERARKVITPERLSECVERIGGSILLPDQDVFNVVCGDCCLRIDDELWNYDAYTYVRYLAASGGVHDVDWVMRNTSVLHFSWPHKPWKAAYVGRFGPLYKHYIRLSERHGESPAMSEVC